jgi:DivIVA domain-containing protein
MISLAAVLVLAALAWGVAVLLLGRDPGLEPAEPDGQAVPLPAVRPLTESDLDAVRFDTTMRGYRMQQVDQALHRAAYDIGYKEELIGVLEAEVSALREGRLDEAETLRQARDAASRPRTEPAEEPEPAEPAASETDGEPVALGTFHLGETPTVGAGPVVGAGPQTDGADQPDATAEPDDSVDDDLATATVRRPGARSDEPDSEVQSADGEK